MKASEIRKSFLDFFGSKNHKIIKSDSLVPRNDPTLLFTGAGMNQFKDYFLGLKTDLKRVASVQKCLRTGDLDQVGKTPYHHSFFEMLGNFSFGDYFKEEAIQWAWEFLTKTVGLDPKRLYVSVHRDDREALAIWSKKIGIPERLIAGLGDESNFWPANAPKDGPNGPCGPCSEIFFDQGPTYPGASKRPWFEDESGRYAEIWNLVFTQFERQDGGRLAPLKSKNIDTGMGFERLVCILQGKRTNFETDLFIPINSSVQSALRLPARQPALSNHIYAISDHVRAIVFAIVDGVIPANEGRGYVIRKLIRRALWRAHEALTSSSITPHRQLEGPFLYLIASVVVDAMSDAYPELVNGASSAQNVIRSEEERFLKTLENGLSILENRLQSLRKTKVLPGEIVFELYDTYGFPVELTQTIVKKSGMETDEKGFVALLENQRRRAKASSKIADTIFATREVDQELTRLPKTKFLGYQTLASEGKVLWIGIAGASGAVVLDQTPFYPEGGGQVGDQGVLEGKDFKFLVTDTQEKEGVMIHYGKPQKGKPEVGSSCKAQVNRLLREATKRNHTATHLLQAALRSVLGNHVRQVGSLVNPEKLRFDFTHGKAMTADELKKVEAWVNEAILEDQPVQATVQNYDAAMRAGTLAFFGDKYGDEVRVVEVPGRSKELCGGTHCKQTGEIGSFVITNETSIGSGTRRIEALTGMNAVHHTQTLQESLNQISSLLKVSSDYVISRIETLQKKVRELGQHGGKLKEKTATVDIDSMIKSAKAIGKIKLITDTVANEGIEFLRYLVDQIRTRASQGVIALFSTQDSKVHMIVALTKDLSSQKWDAKHMAQSVAPLLEGSAGGRKDLAQGGGRKAQGIKEAVKALSDFIHKNSG